MIVNLDNQITISHAVLVCHTRDTMTLNDRRMTNEIHLYLNTIDLVLDFSGIYEFIS